MSIDPTAKRFLETLAAQGGPPISTLQPDDARRVLARAQAGNVSRLPVDIEDTTFPTGPTGSVRVRIYRPKGSVGTLPVVVYLHGGGWILGDAGTHDRLVRQLVNGAGAAVVFVDFDRSPEVAYPIPLEQSYAATRYVADNAAALRLDATRLAVAGDSAGGNLAAAVALLAAERNGPKLAFQLLFYPVTDADLDTGSYRAFGEGHWLTRTSMRWFWDAYCPDLARRKEPTASPLQASRSQLAAMPPTLVIVGENDVLRDEGEAYAAKLADAGVRVTSVRYNGMIHDFAMLDALRDTPAARAAVAQANETLRRELGVIQRVPEGELV